MTKHASAQSNDSHQAVLARAEQMVEVLRNSLGRPLDEASTQRMLEYLRRCVAGTAYHNPVDPDDDDPGFHETIAWCADHGQSSDWLFDGNPVNLIRAGAFRSPRGREAAKSFDPIFAAIEQHRATVATYEAAVLASSRLDGALPDDKTRTAFDVHQQKIVETDDPQWIASEQHVWSTMEAMDDAATDLLGIEPLTLQGAVALLQYMAAHLAHYGDAMGFPSDLVPDDGHPDTADRNVSRPPEAFVMQNVAETLARLAVA